MLGKYVSIFRRNKEIVMPKASLKIEEFQSLCDYNSTTNTYESKSGEEYIEALSRLFRLVNKNDKPFTIADIKKEPTLDAFKFDGVKDYEYICDLRARPLCIKDGVRENEKILAVNFCNKLTEEIFKSSKGVSYMITCLIDGKEHIIKIGQTRTPFMKRLGSYNCGVVNNWRTASTTNIKMLQSMVTTRQTFKLYIYDCSADQYQITWHGVQSTKFASPKSLAVEDIMVKQFIKEFGKKPLANIQADATAD